MSGSTAARLELAGRAGRGRRPSPSVRLSSPSSVSMRTSGCQGDGKDNTRGEAHAHRGRADDAAIDPALVHDAVALRDARHSVSRLPSIFCDIGAVRSVGVVGEHAHHVACTEGHVTVDVDLRRVRGIDAGHRPRCRAIARSRSDRRGRARRGDSASTTCVPLADATCTTADSRRRRAPEAGDSITQSPATSAPASAIVICRVLRLLRHHGRDAPESGRQPACRAAPRRPAAPRA